MLVLHFALTETAGMPYRIWRASRAANIGCRTITFAHLNFPGDIIDPEPEAIIPFVREAEVLHLHCVASYQAYRPERMNVPFLVHIHGRPDRENRPATPFPHVVATPDLLEQFPQAVFVPNLILPDELPLSAALGSGPLRIYKSSSLHDKHHELFSSVIKDLLTRYGQRLELVTTHEHQPHAQQVNERATCHISFDHLHGYYGLESLESLAQGLIAINGATAPVMAALEKVIGSPPPFLLVPQPTPEALREVLIKIIDEALDTPAIFEARRQANRDWIEKYYTPDKLIVAWRYLYEALQGKHPWPTTSIPFVLNPRFHVLLDKLPDIVF